MAEGDLRVPTVEMGDGVYSAAISARLVWAEQDGWACLRLRGAEQPEGEAGTLVVWREGWSADSRTREVLDADAEPYAGEGDLVEMGGGSLTEPVGDVGPCTSDGEYWVVGTT